MNYFYPDVYQKSIYTINYSKLLNNGIKCLLFDLDNTCIPYTDKKPTKQLKNLFDKLQDFGFKVIIFSNSGKERLEPFKTLANIGALIADNFDVEIPEIGESILDELE